MKTWLIPLTVLTLFACGRDESIDDAEDADESADVTTAEAALTSELSDEVSQPVSADAEALAASASVRVSSGVTPAGCLTSTTAGAKVTYVFNDCTGKYGLVHVTGTVTATYARAAGGAVQVTIQGSGVKVNKSTLNLNAVVKASQSGSTKTAQVTTDNSGTGPRGGSLSVKGAYTVSYDSAAECISLDGTWSTAGASRSASTQVTGYKRCKGQCPASGGSIVHTTTRNNVVTVTYDGDATASWSTSNGRSGTVNLQCGS